VSLPRIKKKKEKGKLHLRLDVVQGTCRMEILKTEREEAMEKWGKDAPYGTKTLPMRREVTEKRGVGLVFKRPAHETRGRDRKFRKKKPRRAVEGHRGFREERENRRQRGACLDEKSVQSREPKQGKRGKKGGRKASRQQRKSVLYYEKKLTTGRRKQRTSGRAMKLGRCGIRGTRSRAQKWGKEWVWIGITGRPKEDILLESG